MAKKSRKKSFYNQYIEPFASALIIALVIRALVIYPFRIPTGSMKNTLLVGDFLLANKFVYGLRSPDWLGIPYTEIGVKVPFIKIPGFRKPKRGDVVIFKYPRDISKNYIKRCVGLSGDTIEVIDKKLHVNGVEIPEPPKGRHNSPFTYAKGQQDQGYIYPLDAGNRDNYGPVIVPSPGDTYHFQDSTKNLTDWFTWIQIAVYEGHYVKIDYKGESKIITESNYNLEKDPYTIKNLAKAIQVLPASAFQIDGQTLDNYTYTVKNRHYFLMGDNRDDSLDSRYWGFLPDRLVVGEALITYWSWNSEKPFYQLLHKIRWNRILRLIR